MSSDYTAEMMDAIPPKMNRRQLRERALTLFCTGKYKNKKEATKAAIEQEDRVIKAAAKRIENKKIAEQQWTKLYEEPD